MNKVENLICAFSMKFGGHLQTLELVKCLYLLDVYHIKNFGKQYTDIEWIRYKKGPWADDLKNAITNLQTKKMLTVDSKQTKDYFDYKQFKCTLSDKEFINKQFDPFLQELIDKVHIKIARKRAKRELENYIYNTKPMLVAKDFAAQDKQKINMTLAIPSEQEIQEALREFGI